MSVDYEMVECTMEEVAERLSFQEGRKVTVAECRKIECHALRKLRSLLQDRGIEAQDLISLGRRPKAR